MRLFIVGGGGREHALAWKLSQSENVSKIFCAPGNAGIAQLAECVAIDISDLQRLADFAEKEKIGLTIVGPEAPLVAGIADLFESRGLPIFAPSKDPARLEGSKTFAKRLMQSSGIPTARFWICDTPSVARARIADFYRMNGQNARIVIKADGLAAGKGVTVAASQSEADDAIALMMETMIFGKSGSQVVVEECMEGEEASIMAITDGDAIVPLLPSQDHKRVFNSDEGPNTGGMGAYCPTPFLADEFVTQTIDAIIRPAVHAIRELGIPYKGLIYAGIMLTSDGPKCIEFNCRFGDPETEAVLPLMETDLLPLLIGATDCTLDTVELKWKSCAAVNVVAASEGYPGKYQIGKKISGVENAALLEDCIVFHSGTKRDCDNTLITDGGRVLSVTGVGDSLAEAAERAYRGMRLIRFGGIHYRDDIGKRFI